jgi:hypothetical protein
MSQLRNWSLLIRTITSVDILKPPIFNFGMSRINDAVDKEPAVLLTASVQAADGRGVRSEDRNCSRIRDSPSIWALLAQLFRFGVMRDSFR